MLVNVGKYDVGEHYCVKIDDQSTAVRRISGNGNECFFRSISYALFDNDAQYHNLNYNTAVNRTGIPYSDLFEQETVEEYRNAMLNGEGSDRFGGNREAAYLQTVLADFGLNVNTYDSKGMIRNDHMDNQAARVTINLLYLGAHFDLIITNNEVIDLERIRLFLVEVINLPLFS